MENNCYVLSTYCFGFPRGSDGKESSCNVGALGWEDPLEKEMAIYVSILA